MIERWEREYGMQAIERGLIDRPRWVELLKARAAGSEGRTVDAVLRDEGAVDAAAHADIFEALGTLVKDQAPASVAPTAGAAIDDRFGAAVVRLGMLGAAELHRLAAGVAEGGLPERLVEQGVLTMEQMALALAEAASQGGPAETIATGDGLDAGPAATIDDSIGRSSVGLGRYEIVREIASGGMGKVLEVRDRELGRPVAAKVIKQGLYDTVSAQEQIVARARAFGAAGEDPEALAQHRVQLYSPLIRFVQEAVVVSQLDHPNILPIYEFGLCGPDLPFSAFDTPYYTMKLVRGESLDERIRALRATPDRASVGYLLDCWNRICQAMIYAHGAGVVHRDLKPRNVLISDHDEVLVIDWGLLLVTRRDAFQLRGGEIVRAINRLTRGIDIHAYLSGDERMSIGIGALGTPKYAAPEQMGLVGSIEDIDHRADVFALGAILQDILELDGSGPQRWDDAWEARYGLDADVLRSVLDRCYQEEPARRYADVEELVAAVGAARE